MSEPAFEPWTQERLTAAKFAAKLLGFNRITFISDTEVGFVLLWELDKDKVYDGRDEVQAEEFLCRINEAKADQLASYHDHNSEWQWLDE